MEIWGITHPGVVREQNQDAYAYQRFPDGSGVVLVCDGMGGAKAGNIASALAVETFMHEILHQNGPENESDQQRLERSAGAANDAVFHRAATDLDCMGMGTTLVCALVRSDGTSLLLNEGDSRGYHISENGIVQVTRDHSLVAGLVERGELTEEQARTHPHKNLITRALGAEERLRADFFVQPLSTGEFLLLCSDGLSNLISSQEMLYETLYGGTPEDCCQRLLEIALSRGAPDNVTVALVRY